MPSSAALVALSIPSPSWSGFSIGPLNIRAYALCLLTGIIFAWWFGQRRFIARGGSQESFERIMLITVVGGIICARLYHVITDNELYFGPGRHPIEALYIWNGGLGIWGAVGGGAAIAYFLCRREGVRFAALADCIAPGLLMAQGIGRLGNWFNQELFGGPTTLPWGLSIDPAHRPPGFEQYATFHPTFLYEMLWNFAGAALLLFLERKYARRLRQGQLFAAYVAVYTLGRFWVEALRIDPANHFGGWRINSYTSLIVFLAGVIAFWILRRSRPAREPVTVASRAVSDSELPDEEPVEPRHSG